MRVTDRSADRLDSAGKMLWQEFSDSSARRDGVDGDVVKD